MEDLRERIAALWETLPEEERMLLTTCRDETIRRQVIAMLKGEDAT